MAEERGLLVDVEGFNNAMEEARERSRNAQNKVKSSLSVLFLYICLQLYTEYQVLIFCGASAKKKN